MTTFEIHKELGYGFLEKVYQKAMQVELKYLGLKIELETPIKVRFKGHIIGDYFADLLVEEKVVVELGSSAPARRIEKIGGRFPSNRISTTLPRTETTVP